MAFEAEYASTEVTRKAGQGGVVTEDVSMAERVRALETWSSGHEKQCGERYALLMKVIGFGGALILVAATFAMNRLSSQQDAQMALLRQVAEASARH